MKKIIYYAKMQNKKKTIAKEKKIGYNEKSNKQMKRS